MAARVFLNAHKRPKLSQHSLKEDHKTTNTVDTIEFSRLTSQECHICHQLLLEDVRVQIVANSYFHIVLSPPILHRLRRS